MPLPVAHGLVGASIVKLGRPTQPSQPDWKPLLLGAALAIAPDLDFFFVWVLPLGRSWHRAFSHSFVMALVVFCLLLGAMGTARLRSALVYGLAFLSHGLLDFATTKFGGGVELLWPFSMRRFKLGIVGMSEFGMARPTHIGMLIEMIKYGLIELIIFAPIFLAILLLRQKPSSSARAV